MITTCTVCQARYRLDGEKVPRRVIRVRCPACSGVFQLDGTAERTEKLADPGVPGIVTGFDTGPAQPAATVSEPGPGITVGPPSPPEPAAAAQPDPPAAAEKTETPTPRARRRRSKEEMLARALVSDILVYNRDQRDSALSDGSLVEALGPEIKKSWELYKEKVTPEVANSNDFFREALNEILADGEKVF